MIACVIVRDFAVAVERLYHPPLAGAPVVVLSASSRPRVVGLDAGARAAGVTAGSTRLQAQHTCPSAQWITARELVYRRELADWRDALGEYANKREAEFGFGVSAVYLAQWEGVEALYAGTCQRFGGACVGVGVATDKFSARAAAAVSASTGQIVRVAGGASAAFLAPYPAHWLPLDRDMAHRLPLLGLERIGQIAALTRFVFWEQFPQAGRWVHDLASGRDPRPVQHQPPALELRAEQALDDPLRDQLPLAAVLLSLAEGLLQALGEREVNLITVQMRQVDGIWREAHWRMPLHTLAVLARQIENLWPRLGLSAPVSVVRLRLGDLQPRVPRQLSLFDTPRATPLEVALPSWIARYPTVSFCRPQVLDLQSGRPERRFTLERIAL